VNELPAIANGYVTFGSFNHLAKMNEPLLKMWAKILRATPASKLRLKAASLGCASVQQRVRQVMSDAGIAPDRLELLGWVAPAEHLAQYHRVDIALDTYPYHGTTTTCESFWMGVPVVTLAGESHVSRVGVSLLSNMGLSQLIAQAPEQYVQIAVDLANGLPRLAELRRTLRVRMGASPLMDGVQFARDVEAAYRLMWRDWSGRT
jgi:predicted O-linked N-acetylglucosamine transferase (SPINDLY family)